MIPFKILVWNCRGLNNSETQDALVSLVRQRNPSIIFLSETLASPDLLSDVRRNLGFDGVICSPCSDECRGLGLFWHNEIPVRLRNYSTNHIDVKVGAIGSARVFRFTGICGVATMADRIITWNLLRTLAAQLNMPWIVVGDFNEILCLEDKSGGPPCNIAQMNRFRQALVDCDLMDMGFVGSRYTWANRFTKERPDRACQNVHWRNLYPFSRVLTLPLSRSEHCPLLIEVIPKLPPSSRTPKAFRFEEMWLQHDDLPNVINQGWMTPATETVDLAALETILDSMQAKVTEEMNRDLLAPYTDGEIKTALFQMHPSKSPGQDVRDILCTGRIPQESNFTYLTLIPKIKEPQLPSDLRPIALCNVVYKIASKVLANRLKMILPQIVSPLQSAFVPGRLISDNTLVATELDISKAYDRLEWQYVEAVLLKLGFCRDWVSVVLATIKSVSYSVLVNGNPTGFILPTRGIRQGDPLSPYLFILCAEGLSSLISSCVQNGSIKGLLMSPTAPVIHHLLFADDSFLFGEATVHECQAFKNLLSIYARALGQMINLQKSSVVFSGNVSQQVRNHLSSILGVKCVKEHGLYLGLPIHVGHNKNAIFSYLKERLSKKLISWRSKILSAGGKELLIKVVAQTSPNYVMNCYLLPKSLCDDLQQLCSQFFWGSIDEKRKIHWQSWDCMCIPKEAGGLGFKHLHAHNLAMLAKQGWRLLSNPDSLVARVFKAIFHPWGSFLTIDMGDRPSYSWRNIMEARLVLHAGLFWRIGDGTSVKMWEDDWIPNVPAHSLEKPPDTIFDMVSNLINAPECAWDIPAVHACFPPDVASHMLSIPLSTRVGVDKAAWKLEKWGSFSVKSAYTIARDFSIGNVFASASMGDPYAPLWKALWKANVPNKVAIFGWRAAH
ncbi:uncharacterized protein LOC112199199 [Rosa chinensis]|uniref:uncharacterized protein LOC112199199 n=1 Tax=Rosa chinensis TaxID=74649 RepID=UPI000D094CC3|nr:uncharacterized protein LOC112199199 [Rosa chinensis]